MSPEELRAAMRTLGYRTQTDLAAAIGVSRSAVSLWLEGKVGVPRPVAMLLRMLISAPRRSFSAAFQRHPREIFTSRHSALADSNALRECKGGGHIFRPRAISA